MPGLRMEGIIRWRGLNLLNAGTTAETKFSMYGIISIIEYSETGLERPLA